MGFELIEIQHEKFVWLQNDGQKVLLRPGNNNFTSKTYQQANIAIVIYSDKLHETVKDFTQKGVISKGKDGVNCYTFTDPDGNRIQLVNPDHK